MTPIVGNRTLEEVDLLFSQHKKEICPRDCIFCCSEQLEFDSPLEIIVDRMLEIHLDSHSKMIGYPFVEECEYCRVEWRLRKEILS